MTIEDDVWSKKHYHIEDVTKYDLTPVPFLVETVPFFKSKGITSILDAGCGQGRNSLYLAQQGFFVHGIDASEKAVPLCRELLESHQQFRYSVHQHRLQELSGLFLPDVLEVIVSVTVLTHILDADQVINEFYTVLRSGGYVLADFANLDDSTYEYISKGEKVSANAFLEQGTTVVYRTKDEVEKLFPPQQWKIQKLEEIKFIEPPHPGSRPFEHEHCSYVVLAQSKKLPPKKRWKWFS
ncbi:MAG: class I SAM-dependent methyltransferase [Candidatus Woesearchaeota archaeon]